MSDRQLQGEPAAPAASVEIHLLADADADVLARIANVILLANAPPWRVLFSTKGAEVRVEIELRDIEDSVLDRICRKLSQLTCVTEIGMHLGVAPSNRG